MSKALPLSVRDNLEKSRDAALAAVASYNRPGPRFRTAQYLVLIVIAWTSVFHAIFYKRRIRPWYRKRTSGSGKGIRYQKIDREPRHWDLSECLKQFFGTNHPPVRKNLEFLLGLRNKIEHRQLPALDARLYGECQAALLNLEDILITHFGNKYALAEQLAVSLQFSRTVPQEKKVAARILASSSARSVVDYIERFRGGLASNVLNSMQYSYSVFLVPKVANRANSVDCSVEFVKVNEASPEELDRLSKLNVLIKEKHIPITNIDLLKPGDVVLELNKRLSYEINIHAHTVAWKYYEVRPAKGDPHPERTRGEYCVYDPPHKDYLYTRTWVEKLAKAFRTPDGYKKIVGRYPNPL